jgi:hypothetical protein
MKKILCLFTFITSFCVLAQQDERGEYYREKPFYIGAGLGLDFGGIGGKLEYMFLDYGGLFFGAGYNFNGVGVNGGVMLKGLPAKQFTPYFLGMFGYTGAVVIQGASQYNLTDYGVTLGGGIEIKTKNLNVWQIGLLLPFRSERFKNHYQEL